MRSLVSYNRVVVINGPPRGDSAPAITNQTNMQVSSSVDYGYAGNGTGTSKRIPIQVRVHHGIDENTRYASIY